VLSRKTLQAETKLIIADIIDFFCSIFTDFFRFASINRLHFHKFIEEE